MPTLELSEASIEALNSELTQDSPMLYWLRGLLPNGLMEELYRLRARETDWREWTVTVILIILEASED